MDFLGQMFQGIGDTFTAGSQAHQAVINERNIKRQVALGQEQLNAQAQSERLALILSDRNMQSRLIVTAIVVMVVFVIAIVWIKK